MGHTKRKLLRTRDFLRFSEKKYIFLKTITRNRALLCTSNNQILKFLKVINKM